MHNKGIGTYLNIILGIIFLSNKTIRKYILQVYIAKVIKSCVREDSQ